MKAKLCARSKPRLLQLSLSWFACDSLEANINIPPHTSLACSGHRFAYLCDNENNTEYRRHGSPTTAKISAIGLNL